MKKPGKHKSGDDSVLLQFAPLIYMTWADGDLSPDELARVRSQVERASVNGADTSAIAKQWLDPASPPSAAQMNGLLETMRRAGARRNEKPRRSFSLTEFGRQLASRNEEDEELPPQLRALQDIEHALGVSSADALQTILGRDEPAGVEQRRSFDPVALNRFLEGWRRDVRTKVFAVLQQPVFALDSRAPTREYRERVLEGCHVLAQHGFGAIAYPEFAGGKGDAAVSAAIFETIAFHDLSLLIKYGVHFGLFGGSILQLGTRAQHEKYLPAVGRLELPGCFAMTETAHGSNVRDIETTATYDAATQEFVIHTPHPGARKDYIGNAALHAQVGSVFAQLDIAGERHGVHAFLVPLRDSQGAALPGVRLEDCGEKAGLNGVDNGRIYFDRVRVPRENLLNRFADVSPDGKYTSEITNPSRRFFTMLGTLVAGRISIAGASGSVAKTALTIALRYTAARRQFGPEGAPEVPVLSYLNVQRSLLPRLAVTFALDAALDQLIRTFGEGKTDARDIETSAAGLKAFASTHALETVQASREACGGAGYLLENRFGTLRDDTDIFTTFEGANPVLLQLVAKALLGGLREQFGEMRFLGIARYLGGRASTALAELNPIVTRRTDPDHLRDAEFQGAALRYREERLLTTAARRLKARMDEGADSFDALNQCQDHVIALARAHVERQVMEAFVEKIAALDDVASRTVLERIRALAGLSFLDAERAWFLEAGYFEAAKSRAIRQQVNELCGELAPDAVTLVNAFGIPDAILRAPISRTGFAN